jgi:hypothetical protein
MTMPKYTNVHQSIPMCTKVYQCVPKTTLITSASDHNLHPEQAHLMQAQAADVAQMISIAAPMAPDVADPG